MLHILIYFLVALAATTVGSLTGMGGGVIIKPVLDALHDFDAVTIGVLSSATVLVMALVSVAKQMKSGSDFDRPMALWLGAGSVLGGVLGERLLALLAAGVDNRHVLVTQNSILALIIVLVFYYMVRLRGAFSLHLQGRTALLSAGVFLGLCSSFLGIGGGPVNVALIIFLFSSNAKNATVCSIVTMLFAQISKLTAVALGTGFALYNMHLFPAMAVGGVLGGFLGATLNHNSSEKTVVICFNLAQVLVFSLCVYNIAQNLAR